MAVDVMTAPMRQQDNITMPYFQRRLVAKSKEGSGPAGHVQRCSSPAVDVEREMLPEAEMKVKQRLECDGVGDGLRDRIGTKAGLVRL